MPFYTTRQILEAYANYEYFGLIVYGPLRHGKSSFSIQVLAEVYSCLNQPDWKEALEYPFEKWVDWFNAFVQPNLDWNAWQKWMCFLPEEFFSIVDMVQKTGKQAPLIVWDDAGLWASQYRWAEEFAKRLSDYLSVAATDFASIIFTTPDPRWVLKHIRDLPGGHTGKVIKVTGNPYQKTRRYIKVYEGWLLPDLKKSGVKPIYIDMYDVRLPQKVFLEYDAYRRKYAEIAKQRAIEIVQEMVKRRGINYALKIQDELETKFGITTNQKPLQ